MNKLENLTLIDVLYILIAVVTVWFITSVFSVLIKKGQKKRWKPDPYKIRYKIENTSKRYKVEISILQERGRQDMYLVEYKDISTGKITDSKVLDFQQYKEIRDDTCATKYISTLTFYVVAPEGLLSYELVRTSDVEPYTPFIPEDITKQMVKSVIMYFLSHRELSKERTRAELYAAIQSIKHLPYALDKVD